MLNCHVLLYLVTTWITFVVSSSRAENWNAWRGPRGDGTSSETNVPVKWNRTENIAWQVEIPGVGHASPVVWNDHVFLVGCETKSEQRFLLCLDRKTGGTKWRENVVHTPLETKHPLNSYASGTPTTDGETIYVAFLELDGKTLPARNVSTPRPVTAGKLLVAAYDFEGNRKWISRPGSFVSIHGFCSCPILYENLLIFNGDHDGDSYIVALDKTNGETVWKVPRDHQTRSYVTPLIRKINGRTQMMLSGSLCVTSYDPSNGILHWFIDGPTEQFVASLVYDGRLLLMTAGYPEHHILAIDPRGTGNVTDSHIVWRTTKGASYVPSPVISGEYFLIISDEGIASCFVTSTGERAWRKRLADRYSASAVTANGLVYFLADGGQTTVIKPSRELEVVAANELGESCVASPAISQGQIFIRGEEHLFCIGEPVSDE